LTWKESLKRKADGLRADTLALHLAARRPDVPWYAKAIAVAVVAYALSPIDLIPDFIPVLGYLDDLVLLPLGIALAVRLVPADVLSECRAEARRLISETSSKSWVAAAVVIGIWLLSLGLILRAIHS
jgi:uncharacterized membrane protein YkvA (DUF1232 family)